MAENISKGIMAFASVYSKISDSILKYLKEHPQPKRDYKSNSGNGVVAVKKISADEIPRMEKESISNLPKTD
jgi:hypothetical protein